MPLVKRTSKPAIHSVFENPVTSSNTIYLEGEAYNKTTLAPIFNGSMYNTYGTQSTSYTGTNYYRSNDGTTNGYNTRSGDAGLTMFLTKEVAYCNQTTATRSNDYQQGISYTNKLSMDPTLVAGTLRKITDSSNNVAVFQLLTSEFFNYTAVNLWYNPTLEFYNQAPTQSTTLYNGDYSTNDYDYFPIQMYTIKDPGSSYVSLITKRLRSYGSSAYPQGYIGFALGRQLFNSIDTTATSSSSVYLLTWRDDYFIQYIGQSSVNGQPIYLYNYRANDYSQYCTRHNVSAQTTTDLNSFTTAPSASGTSAGGARTTNGNIGDILKWSSSTFADPTSSGNVGWYTPYFDTSLNYQPFWFQWNKSTDVFTRNSDISITGTVSSSYMSGIYGSPGTQGRNQTGVYNETFVNGGNRYLTVIPMHGSYGAYDAIPNARKILTYSVNASNPKLLTFHSYCQVPTTIRQTVWLNDAKTILGVFGTDVFYVYTWDNTNGWVLTSTIAEKFTAVGRDSTDRIWATSVKTNGTYADIHVLTTTFPTRISITPDQTTYNYTGTVINGTLSISAYNITGARVQANVQLTISGTTMTFDDNSTSKTVTTSTSADISQAIKIIAAGQSDILSTVAM